MKDETKTEKYKVRYRQLKTYYENQLGESVSDKTWYRILKFVKDYLDYKFNIYDEDVVITLKAFAKFRQVFKRFSFSDFIQSPVYPIYQKFSTEGNYYTCTEFLQKIKEYLDLSRISDTTIYKWFRDIKCPYDSTTLYSSKDLAFFIIATLRSPKVTIIVPDSHKLPIGV